MEVILSLIIGLIVSGLGCWLIMRSQIQATKAQKQASDEKLTLYCSQREALSTENNEQKQKIEELNNSLHQLNSENNRYREEIELANQKSAAANAQREQLNHLRQELDRERSRNKDLQEEKTNLTAKLSSLTTELQDRRRSMQEQSALLENIEQKFAETFEVLSSRALQYNNQQLIEIAKETFISIHQSSHNQLNNLVSPLSSSLKAFNRQIKEIENSRKEDKGKISEQLKSVVNAQYQLQTETANLSKALRQPVVRGRWGEMQLKRVVEMSGMQEHCDFSIQETIHTEDDPIRPDLIVKLSGKKQIIVDSKAPLKAYLEAVEAQDESRQIECFKQHAGHMLKLTIQHWVLMNLGFLFRLGSFKKQVAIVMMKLNLYNQLSVI